ncbi:hypothetical protein MPSYJ_44420 [Mycolicibacterium psychrotolerans]|uniref:Uncharacterized protein n=1 Tax=Mycolicibacterium psychrotolerans TaxID=216929 RepID=A0A7I7MF93_9MYCO|nr:hypothetical protein MPSYJ_44420 [Mycolicibacterium psychrotolerans]
MPRSILTHVWLIASLMATLGAAIGVLLANLWMDRADRFTAQATLAMLPVQDVPASEVSGLWEVLNQGQATRSAAIVMADGRWLDAGASAAGVPKSDLGLSAGAIPDTTLITVKMEARSAAAAGAALKAAVDDAMSTAAAATGPFKLQMIGGSVASTSATPLQMLGAFGGGGLLIGAGCGVLISRSARTRSKSSVLGHSSSHPAQVKNRHSRDERIDDIDCLDADDEFETLSLRITSR